MQKAMSKLIRGGEFELAVGIGLALKTVTSQLKIAAEFLSRRCEKTGHWYVIYNHTLNLTL